jgi:DNA-binding Lrp family transcriptional regulator
VLAKELKLKRPTVTAVRNRLVKKKMYEAITIPNFHALGYSLLSVVYEKLKVSVNQLKNTLEKIKLTEPIVYLIAENGLVMIILSRDIVEFQNIFSKITQQMDIFKKLPEVYHFPIETNEITNYVDLSDQLKDVFDLRVKHAPLRNTFLDAKPRKLKTNERKVIGALVNNPEAGISLLSELTGLTKPTVINIKKKLFQQGFLQKRVLPEVSKLGLNFMALMHLRYKPNITNYTIDKIKALSPKFSFFISGKTGLLALGYFRSYEDYQKIKSAIPQQVILGERTFKLLVEEISPRRMILQTLANTSNP